jgi:hypothetical protein
MRRSAKFPEMCLVAALLAACAPAETSEGRLTGVDEAGEAVVSVAAESLTAAGVKTIHVKATPSNVERDLVYDAWTSRFKGTLVFPPEVSGPQLLQAVASGDAGALGWGEVGVHITPGRRASAVLRIFSRDFLAGARDFPPLIQSLAASSLEPQPGEPVQLVAVAVDIDGDDIAYQWSDDCAGSFASPRAASTAWSKATAGACTLTLAAYAHFGSTSEALAVTVLSRAGRAEGSATVEGTYVSRPLITDLAFSSASGESMYVIRSAPEPLRIIRASEVLRVRIGTPAGVGQDLQLESSCGTMASLGTRVDYSWTAPEAGIVDGGIVCKLTARAKRVDPGGGTEEDEFSVGLQVR